MSKGVNKLKDTVAAKYKKIDILVSCAGIWESMALDVFTDNALENAFKANTSSVMYMTRAFREMLKNNNGNIVNVASIGGLHSHISG